MTQNIYDFPDRKQIEEEAGEWLIRLDSDKNMSEYNAIQLREWLKRSPVHRQELANLLKFYNRMNILTELSVPLIKTPALNQEVQTAQPHKNSFRISPIWQLAGVYVVAAIFAVLVLVPPGDPIGSINEEFDHYATATGEQSTITLADGSVLELNTDSQLEVKYSSSARNIILMKGEVYFKVAKDIKRPFNVYARNGRIEAIGTEFSVRLKEDDMNITVAEGRVKLITLKKPVDNAFMSSGIITDSSIYDESIIGTLDAGQSTTIEAIIINETNISERKMEFAQNIDGTQLSKQLSWRSGLLIFTGDPLEEVIGEISRYSPIAIEILDPKLKAIRIGGQFRIGDVEAMLASLEANFQLHIIRLDHNHFQIASAE